MYVDNMIYDMHHMTKIWNWRILQSRSVIPRPCQARLFWRSHLQLPGQCVPQNWGYKDITWLTSGRTSSKLVTLHQTKLSGKVGKWLSGAYTPWPKPCQVPRRRRHFGPVKSDLRWGLGGSARNRSVVLVPGVISYKPRLNGRNPRYRVSIILTTLW